MGRTPIIRNTIIKVLEDSESPLRFSNLLEKVKKKLQRKVYPESLAAANASLIRDGLIEKKLVDGKIAYELSSQFHKQTVKNLLSRLVESFRLEELEANFDLGERTLPNVIYISPTSKDVYETADQSDLKMSVGVDWESPSGGISSIISNDFLLLPENTRNGITNLILWAYWVGIQDQRIPHKLWDMNLDSMETRLQECLRFSNGVLARAKERGDRRQIETEKSIIRILGITLDLLKKDNLHDFLDYASKKRKEVKEAENTILKLNGHFMNTGERTFRNMVRVKSDMLFYGLNSIEEKTDKIKGVKSLLKEQGLSMDTEVWTDLIDFLIDLYSDDSIKKVKGTYEEAIAKAKQYLLYSNDLIDLTRKRQIMATYLWNIPVKEESEKYLKLPQFEEWLKALKAGELSHRIWLFEEEILRDVESAYRAVKRGKKPKPWKIDKEFWTLSDLYELHPQGKNPEFWHELLTALKAQKGKEPYRGGPVPKEFYYEFLEKQREAVKNMLSEQKKKNGRS